jgi:hypothetical protein
MPDGAIHTRRPCHDDLRIGPGGQAQAAVFGADGGAEQAQLLHLLDDLVRVLVGQVELARQRPQFLLGPGVDGIDEGLLVVFLTRGSCQ